MVRIGPITITRREVDGEYDGPLSTWAEWTVALLALGYMGTLVLALQVSEVVSTLVILQILRVSYYAMTGQRLTIQGRRIGVMPDRYLTMVRREMVHWFAFLGVGFTVAYVAEYFGYVSFVDAMADILPTILNYLAAVAA